RRVSRGSDASGSGCFVHARFHATPPETPREPVLRRDVPRSGSQNHTPRRDDFLRRQHYGIGVRYAGSSVVAMHGLGQTRGTRQVDHLLQTPDTFVRAPLPGMKKATAIVHASPAIGARFTQYTAEFEARGLLPASETQRFVYVVDGEIESARG